MQEENYKPQFLAYPYSTDMLSQYSDSGYNGANVGVSLGPVTVTTGGNTMDGINNYNANISLSLARLAELNKQTDQGNVMADVGTGYDFKSGQYSPYFLLGYQRGGMSAGAALDSRMIPQFQMQYQKRF
jgi:hypothetical protein